MLRVIFSPFFSLMRYISIDIFRCAPLRYSVSCSHNLYSIAYRWMCSYNLSGEYERLARLR